ncbi:PQQ-dependent sugar dehydrogenase [Pelagibacteraceae bacterium]|jgi:hypothetical protein|nr:PQQ-dependent sugar dehydrogenase [Pelagibacteraceae bacterium]
MIKNKIFKYFITFLFGISCIFIGYENPLLIETPKKYVKFILKKFGVVENFFTNKQELQTVLDEKKPENNSKIILLNGNSFDLSYEKVINFDGRSAGIFVNTKKKDKLEFDIFLQEGINIKDNSVKELNVPVDIFLKKNGGVKSVIKIEGDAYALISNKSSVGCYYASIVNLNNAKKILSTSCLPDEENIDFNGLGGAYIEDQDHVLLSIGAPEYFSQKIRSLAQINSSKFGKLIKIKKEAFKNEKISKEDYKIYSLGHRNPQGLILTDNKIFSVEHGPQGGDELNFIEEDNNYGWPIVSFGTKYNNGEGYKNISKTFTSPLYSFLPSIAPSSMNICPENLKKYYADNSCFLVLSLRAMSIFVVLVDKKNPKVMSIEQFKIDHRMRHFALDENNKMFQKNNAFFISFDGFGLHKFKFDNFR